MFTQSFKHPITRPTWGTVALPRGSLLSCLNATTIYCSQEYEATVLSTPMTYNNAQSSTTVLRGLNCRVTLLCTLLSSFRWYVPSSFYCQDYRYSARPALVIFYRTYLMLS